MSWHVDAVCGIVAGMIWREDVRTEERAAGLPEHHTCTIERRQEHDVTRFHWFLSVEGDGSEDDEDDEESEERRLDHPIDWSHLSVTGSSETIEQARIQAEQVYRRLLATYEQLTSASSPIVTMGAERSAENVVPSDA